MRIVAVGLLGLLMFVAWRLGVLGIAVAVLVWIWGVAPVPMTILYAAGTCGLAACCVYPRYRPGVVWTEVLIRSPRARRAGPRAVSGPDWDGQVSAYLERLRHDDRAVA